MKPLFIFLITFLTHTAFAGCEAVCTFNICHESTGVCYQGGQNVASSKDRLSIVTGNSYEAIIENCHQAAEESLQSEKEILTQINLYQTHRSRVRSAYLQMVWRIYDYKADAQTICN